MQMSQKNISGLILTRMQAFPLLSVFLIALALRWSLLALGFVDYWGDAHHNLIISKLTLENGFVYSDFKDRHLTWLPLYRYWGSLIMLLTGSYSLVVMNVVNSVIGSLIAAFGAWLTATLTDKKTGLLAGLAIAFMPYLMVFSFISQAEMMGAGLLLLWMDALFKERFWLAALFAGLASLTRYELTFLIGMSMLPLLYFRNYKAVIYSVGGLAFGMGIWSWWAWVNSGNPLNWLFMRIQSTTLSSEYNAQDANFLFDNVFIPITTVLQAFPLVLFFIWMKVPSDQKPAKERPWFFLMGYLTLVHWVFFSLAQLKIMAYPDPRFFILSLPITVIWFFCLWQRGYFRAFVQRRIIFLLLGFSLLQLIVPYFRQYSLQPRKEAGEWIRENVPGNEMIWSDLAVTIVESDRDPRLYISSDNLVPKSIRGTENEPAYILERIEELELEYITSFQGSFDYPHVLWPEMNELQPFEWGGLTFVPVFTYELYHYQEATLHNYFRQQFEARQTPASIWKIYRE